MLIKLHELGCVQFIDWQLNFFVNGNLTNLENEQKNMSEQLSRWSEAIDSARNECHVLNSFTMKQLLHLRKELCPQFINGQTCALLRCLHPCVDPPVMKKILNEAWKQSVSELCDTKTMSEPEAASESADLKLETIGVQELVNKLTDEQQRVYVELVETNRINPLWSIAEILKRKESSSIDAMTNEILLHIADVSEDEEQPCETVLMDTIRASLKLEVDPTRVEKNTANSESTTGPHKNLEK